MGSLLGKEKRGFFLSVLQGGDISTETFVDTVHKEGSRICMLESLHPGKYNEQYGKEDLAKAWEAGTIGSGLRRHSDDQIRPFKPENRPEMTKEHLGWETEEETVLIKNKGDWGSRKGQNVPGSAWELGERLSLEQGVVVVCSNGRVTCQK